MAECFCGCGRKVGITSRGMNKQGRRTVGLLAKLREARDMIERDLPLATGRFRSANADDFQGLEMTDPEVRDAMEEGVTELVENLIAQGEEWEQFWTDAVHGDYLPPPKEARAFKQEWEAWGHQGMATIADLGLPPERGVRALFRGRV
jgi:hypothetical protein